MSSMQSPGDFAKIRVAVTEYVRDYIRNLVRRDWSYQQIADTLLCSRSYVSQLDAPDKYPNAKVGDEVEYRVAELLHGGSVDALRRAALFMQAGGAVLTRDGLSGGQAPLGLPAATEPEPIERPSTIPPDRPKHRRGGTRPR
jgi:hypothetical protein